MGNGAWEMVIGQSSLRYEKQVRQARDG